MDWRKWINCSRRQNRHSTTNMKGELTRGNHACSTDCLRVGGEWIPSRRNIRSGSINIHARTRITPAGFVFGIICGTNCNGRGCRCWGGRTSIGVTIPSRYNHNNTFWNCRIHCVIEGTTIITTKAQISNATRSSTRGTFWSTTSNNTCRSPTSTGVQYFHSAQFAVARHSILSTACRAGNVGSNNNNRRKAMKDLRWKSLIVAIKICLRNHSNGHLPMPITISQSTFTRDKWFVTGQSHRQIRCVSHNFLYQWWRLWHLSQIAW